MAKKRIKYWVLRDSLSKKYLEQWTGIGPAATSKKSEAKRFRTRQAAMDSPAYTFALTFFEPVAVR